MGRIGLVVIGLAVVALLDFGAAPGLALEATPQSVELAPRECCKICRKGKACGDSCISRDKDCNKPPVCACNESDLASRFCDAPGLATGREDPADPAKAVRVTTLMQADEY